jgi:phosphonate transport system substrate-binding protein
MPNQNQSDARILRRTPAGPIFPALLALIVLSSCGVQLEEPSTAGNAFRLAVVYDQGEEVLTQYYQPLLDYLGNRLGRPTELVLASDHAEILDLFDKRQIDIAYVDGATTIDAANVGAIALAVRSQIAAVATYFLSSPDHSTDSILDFKGLRMAFGPEESTDSHWIPRVFLDDSGINPEEFFSEIRYAESLDQTFDWIRSGVVDIGAAPSLFVDALIATDGLPPGVVRMARSARHLNYAWVVRDNALRNEILDAFLSLTRSNPDHIPILDAHNTDGFLPVAARDYLELGRVRSEFLRGQTR